LSRTSAERICKYVDAMGSIFCKAGDLVLLGLYSAEADELTIMQLVDVLGLLQPTVSMSVSSLAEQGLVERRRESGKQHTTSVALTEAGRDRAEQMKQVIESVIVRRKVRKPRN
ncbi:MarR family transcriptional regulator, partial [Paratractidigestivibacter sp.]|uniref:MarR family transcriptional regulator n=1 Tax=Paratractidigestivibacter sp. TaxID=2847316 RepID=UPI0040257F05